MRFLKAALIFCGIGPLIGGITTFFVLSQFFMNSSHGIQLAGLGGRTLELILAFYAVGTPIAFFTAILHSMNVNSLLKAKNEVSLKEVVGSGVFSGLCISILISGYFYIKGATELFAYVWFIAACTFSSLVCSYIHGELIVSPKL